MEDGHSVAGDKTNVSGDGRREKGSGGEGEEKRDEGGKPAAAKTTGAEGREHHHHQHPSPAEMMHRQQLEYQRYRYGCV